MNANDINFGVNPQNWLQANFNDIGGGLGTNTNAPAAPAFGGLGGNSGMGNMGGLGFNMDTAKLALGGISTLGNLWNAFQAQQLAKEQFKFTKGITEKNLANQMKSYNTSLEDKIRSRAAVEGQSQSQADDYMSRNRVY